MTMTDFWLISSSAVTRGRRSTRKSDRFGCARKSCMRKEYAELQATVEGAGFFTTFQPIREPGDRIVCASHAYTSGPRRGGLGGNSFWVAKRAKECSSPLGRP